MKKLQARTFWKNLTPKDILETESSQRNFCFKRSDLFEKKVCGPFDIKFGPLAAATCFYAAKNIAKGIARIPTGASVVVVGMSTVFQICFLQGGEKREIL